MLNVLIVDDEILDREGLRDDLEWEAYMISQVKLARNSQEALDISRDFSPDILITDIQMPGIDGLTLAKELKKDFSNLYIIFISGYGSFTYVQDALKLDAYDYLLKPIDSNEFKAVIEKVVNEIMLTRYQNEKAIAIENHYFENQAILNMRLINGLIINPDKRLPEMEKYKSYLGFNIKSNSFFLAIIQIDNYINLITQQSDSNSMYYVLNVCSVLQKMDIDDAWGLEVAIIDMQSCIAIISSDEHKPDTAFNYECIRLAEYMIQMVSEQEDISVSIGVSGIFHDLYGMKDAYDTALKALNNKFILGKGKVYTKGTEQPILPEQNLINFGELGDISTELSKLLVANDKEQLIKSIDNLFDAFEASYTGDKYYLQNVCINIISRFNITTYELGIDIDDLFGGGSKLIHKLINFETILDIRNWMKNIFVMTQDFYSNNIVHENTVISSVLDFIEQNYMREITLKEVADEMHYTPNYLGYVFKRSKGIGFSEYLINYRIKKSLSLLDGNHNKIYEVAIKVGYSSTSSFIKQFKSKYGITPSEYRQKGLPR